MFINIKIHIMLMPMYEHQVTNIFIVGKSFEFNLRINKKIPPIDAPDSQNTKHDFLFKSVSFFNLKFYCITIGLNCCQK